MAGPDSLVVIASYLRPEEAGMLRGLLESAGIVAVLRDEMLSSVHPFLQPIIGGVKLVVRRADAERAREVVRFAGVLPASPQDEPVDIPEDEWSAVSEDDVERVEVPSTATWPPGARVMGTRPSR
jgi:hypothetical protein